MENGAIESPHGHLKKTLHDQLLLRDSRDFATNWEQHAGLGLVPSFVNALSRANSCRAT
jgi:hypothetical protein